MPSCSVPWRRGKLARLGNGSACGSIKQAHSGRTSLEIDSRGADEQRGKMIAIVGARRDGMKVSIDGTPIGVSEKIAERGVLKAPTTCD